MLTHNNLSFINNIFVLCRLSQFERFKVDQPVNADVDELAKKVTAAVHMGGGLKKK